MKKAGLQTIGLLQGAVYAACTFHFGWRPRVDSGWVDDLFMWLVIVSLFLLYRAGYEILATKSLERPIRSIALYAIPGVLFAAITTPFHSTDAFLYLAMARGQSYYGLNPYSEILRFIPGVTNDPAIGAMWMGENANPWLDLPMVYGFLFATLLWLIGTLSGGNWWVALFLLKAATLAAYSVTGWLVLACARRLGHQAPERAFYLFMWSPLIVLHQVANAHNDLMMGCLVAASVYAIVAGRPFWAIPLLMAAVAIKHTPLLLLPFAMALVLRQRGVVQLIGSSLAGLGTLLILGLPYLGEARYFMMPLIVAQTTSFTAGTITSALYYTYRAISRRSTPLLGTLEEFGGVLQIVTTLGMVACLCVIAYRFLKSPMRVPQLLEAWTLAIVAVMSLTPHFYAWYFGGFFPFTLMLKPGTALRGLIITLSVTHLTSLVSVGSKAIGYFVLATGGGILWWRRQQKKMA